MKTHSRNSTAEHAGAWLGHMWRAIVRRDRQLRGWIVKKGVPAPVASASIWILRLLVLAAIFRWSVMLAAAVLVLLIVMSIGGHVDMSVDEDQPQWRHGVAGFGLYRGEVRVDPHNPDDEQ